MKKFIIGNSMRTLLFTLIFLNSIFGETLNMTWESWYNAATNLVLLESIEPTIKKDIKYATNDNFTESVIYESDHLFLHKDVALRLKKVQEYLKELGFGLKVWDGYRPLFAQQLLWNHTPDEKYVSPPNLGGRHTRGTAVDLTLINLSTGQECKMPTCFDDFTVKAHREYADLDEEILHNVLLLEKAMTEIGGFEPYPYEWWHFDIKGWKEHTPLNISFSQLVMINE